jgi:hypothetical protein
VSAPGRVCILFHLHCTVHTHCKEAHYSEPPLCDCDAESKDTPTCDNTRRRIQRPAERIRHRAVKATFWTCALLEAHREYLRVGSERRAGVATTGRAHCLRRHQAQDRKAAHERTAISTLHGGALKDWDEYNKEIESKVIRCECSEDT